MTRPAVRALAIVAVLVVGGAIAVGPGIPKKCRIRVHNGSAHEIDEVVVHSLANSVSLGPMSPNATLTKTAWLFRGEGTMLELRRGTGAHFISFSHGFDARNVVIEIEPDMRISFGEPAG